MDVLGMLYEELETRKGLSLDDKKRYIYIRLCQIFSYDTRYHFVELLGTEGKRLSAEILGRKINLEKVDDFRVCCSSFSLAYQDALKKLLNVDSTVKGNGHRWVELESDNEIIKADGTLGDLTRAKFEIRTRGYRPYKMSPFYMDWLERRDFKIKYMRFLYENVANLLLNGSKAIDYRKYCEMDLDADFEDNDERERFIYESIAEDVFSSLFLIVGAFDEYVIPSPTSMEEFMNHRRIITDCIFPEYDNIRNDQDLIDYFTLYRIQKSFNEISSKIDSFEDAKFLLDYMFQCVIFVNDIDRFHQINLFKNADDDNWSFAPIYVIRIKDRELYFTLKMIEGKWYFIDISLEEAEYLARTHKGQNKELLYKG